MQQKLEVEMNEYQKITRDIEKASLNRQKLVTQLSENDIVKKELSLIEDDAAVYKLIGPVLCKQDTEEAKSNVNKRIEYITNEIKRIGVNLGEMDKKLVEKRKKIMEIQQQLQKA
uniref:Prefoldin subunit 6 n=1 Tax=Arcella intermedia TaxID=1963864 RepID=A0A6B2LSF8_9EUKA